MSEESTEWAFYQEKYGSLGKETHKQFLELVPAKELTTKSKERKAKIKEKTQEKRRLQHSAKKEERKNQTRPSDISESNEVV
jgi:hypothetical protein